MKKINKAVYIFSILAISTILLLLLILFLIVPRLVVNLDNNGDFLMWINTVQDRSPYKIQSVLNLVMFIILCIFGAVIFSNKSISPKIYLIIALLSFIFTILLPSMVYGIDIFVDSTYSLYSPYHSPLIPYSVVNLSQLTTSVLVNNIVSIVIHLFSPQVVLGIFVGYASLRKYKQ